MRDRLQSAECCKFLRALAEPDRLKIVQCLQDGPASVGDLSKRLGIPLANASHHLGLMKSAGLVEGRKQGRFVIYALAPKVLSRRPDTPADTLDFGCCRIQLGRR